MKQETITRLEKIELLNIKKEWLKGCIKEYFNTFINDLFITDKTRKEEIYKDFYELYIKDETPDYQQYFKDTGSSNFDKYLNIYLDSL